MMMIMKMIMMMMIMMMIIILIVIKQMTQKHRPSLNILPNLRRSILGIRVRVQGLGFRV